MGNEEIKMIFLTTRGKNNSCIVIIMNQRGQSWPPEVRTFYWATAHQDWSFQSQGPLIPAHISTCSCAKQPQEAVCLQEFPQWGL